MIVLLQTNLCRFAKAYPMKLVGSNSIEMSSPNSMNIDFLQSDQAVGGPSIQSHLTITCCLAGSIVEFWREQCESACQVNLFYGTYLNSCNSSRFFVVALRRADEVIRNAEELRHDLRLSRLCCAESRVVCQHIFTGTKL